MLSFHRTLVASFLVFIPMISCTQGADQSTKSAKVDAAGTVQSSAAGDSPVLYSVNGKAVRESELSPATSQALYQSRVQQYRQLQGLLEAQLLDQHFAEEAKKSKKSAAEVEAELSAGPAPSDADIKKFYEENKSRIPPNITFDQVKPELVRYMSQMKGAEKRKELLEKVKKSSDFKMLLAEPVAPVVSINTDGFPSKGEKSATVKIVEFADFQCPHCGEAAKAMEVLATKYKGKVEVVFIDFPVNPSGISRVVAEGGYCANKQGKYWEYHRSAFADQQKLTRESPAQIAKTLKLDEAAFTTCLGSAEAKAFVESGRTEGERVGVQGTPSIFINGQLFTDGHDLKSLQAAVDARL